MVISEDQSLFIDHDAAAEKLGHVVRVGEIELFQFRLRGDAVRHLEPAAARRKGTELARVIGRRRVHIEASIVIAPRDQDASDRRLSELARLQQYLIQSLNLLDAGRIITANGGDEKDQGQCCNACKSGAVHESLSLGRKSLRFKCPISSCTASEMALQRTSAVGIVVC